MIPHPRSPREASARRLTVARLKSYCEDASGPPTEAAVTDVASDLLGADPATPLARAEVADRPRTSPRTAAVQPAGPATSGGGQGCAPAVIGLGAGPRVSRDKRLRDLTHAREKSYAVLFAARHATPPLADVEIEKREDDWVATCEAWEEALAELIAGPMELLATIENDAGQVPGWLWHRIKEMTGRR